MNIEVPIPLTVIQEAMRSLGLYEGEVDGVWDLDTGLAINAFFLFHNFERKEWDGWNRTRKYVAAQQLMCRMAGIETGTIDGLVGPQTQYAVEAWHALQRGDTSELNWRDGIDTSWAKNASDKWPTRAGMTKFFGAPGANQAKCTTPYPLRIAWDLNSTTSAIMCNRKVHKPTQRALQRALEHYGLEEIKRLRLDLWGGSLNVRKVRGGSALSIHAWGAAHDWDPERNQLKWKKDRAQLDNPEYDFWWECWEAEGAVSQGRALGYDFMHVQFSKF